MLTGASHRYKGCSITTHSFESMSIPALKHRRFEASYSVVPDTANEQSWQQFSKSVFDTGEHAEANALVEAKASIRLKISDGHLTGL